MIAAVLPPWGFFCITVALDLEEVSKHYNFISQISHQRRWGEGSETVQMGENIPVWLRLGVYESNKNLSTV